MIELDDPQLLARLARDTLAAADEATLLMTGPVRTSEAAVVLHDEDGIPHLWCERGSVVAVAARLHQPAVLTVPVRRQPGHWATLALAGRLQQIHSELYDGRLVEVVATGRPPARPTWPHSCAPT